MPVETTSCFPRRYYYSLLFGIIGIGVLGRLFHFHLTLGSDDQRYIIAARELMGESGVKIEILYNSRILWRAVLALWGVLPGLTLESSAVLMFALSVVSIFFVAAAGKLTFGMLAGLIAAAVYATYPLNIINDVYTQPDDLGVTLLAASLFLFLKYLQDRHLTLLLIAGFMIGLTLGVKEYFVLLSIPFASCLLFEKDSAHRFKALSLFLCCVAAGMSLDFALHFWESGNPMTHWSLLGSYGDRLVDSVKPYAEYSGWKRLARVVVDRFLYIDYLFFSFAGAAGFMILWGLLFGLFCARDRNNCRALLLSATAFFFFLSFMPAKLSPLTFVEIQERYATVLLPFLAVLAGGGIAAALAAFKDRSLYFSAVALLVAAFAYNLYVPNDMMDRARILEFSGIRQILKSAREKQITELFLPGGYDEYVPDSYYSYGVKLRFLKGDVDAESLRGEMRGVFIPRIPYRNLEPFFRMGDPNVVEVGRLRTLGNARELRKELETSQFRKEYIRVPNTSFRSWLVFAGILEPNDQLVGWVYRSNR